jgi:hypothetical protein
VNNPTSAPSCFPTSYPSSVPTRHPSVQPSSLPSTQPLSCPTVVPSNIPSVCPTSFTTGFPSVFPSSYPTKSPSGQPSLQPVHFPSAHPTSQPVVVPTAPPTSQPSARPSDVPTLHPTTQPTNLPTSQPFGSPSSIPTTQPILRPSSSPTLKPSSAPSQLINEYSRSVPPEVLRIDVTSVTKTTMVVDVYLNHSFAYVSCAAFSLSHVLQSSEEVVSAGLTVFTSTWSTAVTLKNLIPSTWYAVYCTTQPIDKSGYLTYSSTLQTKVDVQTLCCKKITVTLKSSTVYEGQVIASGLSLSVDYLPSINITMNLDPMNRNSSIVDSIVSFGTPTITFWNSSLQTTAMVDVIVSNNLPSSSGLWVTVNVTLSGASATEYVVEYIGSPLIQVLKSGQPTVPALVWPAYFSSTGIYVELLFDTSTNRAGYTSPFVCGELLSFVGSSTSMCRWIDDAKIWVYPIVGNRSMSEILNVNDSIGVLANTQLSNKCVIANSTLCDLWARMTNSSVTVYAPLEPASPVVVISSPSQISACQTLILDLRASSGSASRNWKSVSIVASAPISTQHNLDALNHFLSSNYSISDATLIPESLLLKGVDYVFTATLCNVFDSCSSGLVKVAVNSSNSALPVVQILGANYRTVYRKNSLKLQAVGYVTGCMGNTSSSNFVYDWSIARSDGKVASITSSSVDASLFIVSAYVLEVGVEYTFKVDAYHTLLGSTTTASVRVFVLQGSLVATIVGGSTRTIKLGENSTIDASQSFDDDSSASNSSALTFSWRCIQTSPVYANNCSMAFYSAYLLDHAQWVVYPKSVVSVDHKFRMYVSVSDLSRSSETYVDISTSTDDSNTFNTVTSVRSLLYSNPTSKKPMLATVTTSSTSCTAYWTIDDPLTSLHSINLTSLTKTIASYSAVYFNLALIPNALVQRAAFSLTITCGAYTSSIAVTTNGPPLPGLFSVTPSSGTALTTLFSMVVQKWTDEDLPISFQFAYYSFSADSNLVFLSRTEATVAQTLLPASLSLDCLVEVFDVLDASVMATAAVFVANLTQAATMSALSSQINASSNTVDGYKALVALGTTVLNEVNCSGAPNCSSLRRTECSSTVNTCGLCFDDYLGDVGSANTMCLSGSEISSFSGQNWTCSANSPICGHPWMSCNTNDGTCSYMSKSCPEDCSGHGICKYYDASSYTSLDVCVVGDDTCESRCVCANGYSGFGCTTSSTSLVELKSLRSQLVTAFSSVIKQDAVAEERVRSWSSLLYALSLHTNELSDTDMQSLVTMSQSSLSSAMDLNMDPSFLTAVVQANDLIFSAAVANGAALYGNQLTSLLKKYSVIVDGTTVLGEASKVVSGSTFKFIGSVLSTDDSLLQDVSIPASTVQLEDATSSVVQSSIQYGFAGSANPSYYHATLIETAQKTYSQANAIAVLPTAMAVTQSYYDMGQPYSNPLHIGLRSPSTSLLLSSSNVYVNELEVTLKHTDSYKSIVFSDNSLYSFKTTCKSTKDKSMYYYTCPDTGYEISRQCDGTIGQFVDYCPYQHASCATLNVTSFFETSISQCDIKAITAASTVCTCRAVSNNGFSFFSSNDSVGFGIEDSADLIAAPSLTYVSTQYSDKGLINGGNKIRVPWPVIVLYVSLWLVLIFALLYARFKVASCNDLESRLGDIFSAHYFDGIIPLIYRESASVWHRMFAQFVLHHRYCHVWSLDGYFPVVTHTNTQTLWKERALSGLHILTTVSIAILVEVLLLDVQSPEHSMGRTCKSYGVQDICLSEKTVFDNSVSVCRWNSDLGLCFPGRAYGLHGVQKQLTVPAMLRVIVLVLIVVVVVDSFVGGLLRLWRITDVKQGSDGIEFNNEEPLEDDCYGHQHDVKRDNHIDKDMEDDLDEIEDPLQPSKYVFLQMPAYFAGKRLLQRFLYDLVNPQASLSLLSLRRQLEGDFGASALISTKLASSSTVKLVVLVFLMSINCFCFAMSLYISHYKTLGWHQGLCKLFAYCALIDIVVLHSVESICVHVLIPMSVRREVYSAVSVLRTLWVSVSRNWTSISLSLVSQQFAGLRPAMKESIVVLTYNLPSRPLSVSNPFSKSSWCGCSSWSISVMPVGVQLFIARVGALIVCCGLLMLWLWSHEEAQKGHASYYAVFVVVLVVVLGLSIWASYGLLGGARSDSDRPPMSLEHNPAYDSRDEGDDEDDDDENSEKGGVICLTHIYKDDNDEEAVNCDLNMVSE